MTKRLMSALLIITVLVCAFSSCNKLKDVTDVGELITNAEKQLDSVDHTVNISMTFISNDEDMAAALSAFDSTSIALRKSQDKVNIEMNVQFGEFFANNSYTVVENTLYGKSESNMTGATETAKKKAQLTAAEKMSVTNNAGVGAVLSYDDFDSVTLEESDTVHIITCTGLKAESNETLVKVFKSSLDREVDWVSVSDAQLVIRLVDGKYNGMYMTCNYSVSINGVTYDVRMQLVREYDYTTPVSITAPTDVSEYELVPYNAIIK